MLCSNHTSSKYRDIWIRLNLVKYTTYLILICRFNKREKLFDWLVTLLSSWSWLILLLLFRCCCIVITTQWIVLNGTNEKPIKTKFNAAVLYPYIFYLSHAIFHHHSTTRIQGNVASIYIDQCK